MDTSSRRSCPECGARMPEEYFFCGLCGRRLADVDLGTSAEMRQITVMFCDLVGSVRLSHQLDPEAFAAVVRRYQEVCVGAIESHDGYVAQYLGDGILAYFGYPRAGEDAAEQSVRAGLQTLRKIAAINVELHRVHGIMLSVRIGVHTGLVVVENVGAGARRERLALGHTPNLAARLQTLAPPDTLVVSRQTYRLVEGTFRCVDLGEQELEGAGRLVHAYRILEEENDRLLHDPLHEAGAALAVGREKHVARLMAEWHDAASGRGRAVIIEAEPGIGKSHLALEFRRRLGGGSYFLVACRCAPNLEISPFHPIVGWLSRVLNFYPEQPCDERLDTLAFVAKQNGLEEPDVVPLLWSLLTKDGAVERAKLGYSGAQARARIEAILEELILGMEIDSPLMLMVEDVQWIDPSTRDFLMRIAAHATTRPILILVTARSEPDFEWPPECPVTRITLERLGREEIEDVITEVAGQRRLPAPIVARIQEKADGVPLYAQEFTKMVMESGVLEDTGDGFQLRDDVPDLGIPATLKDSLTARLDRLLATKKVAEACSVFGRPFTLDLLGSVIDMPVDELDAALERLVEANVLDSEGTGPDVRYLFRHALLQDAAYESMLRGKRSEYHLRIARHLIERPEADAAASASVAYHLTRAGETEEAATYWCAAGDEARDRWANEEAAKYYGRGISLTGKLSASLGGHDVALRLHTGLAAAVLQQKGYAHPDTAMTIERVAELATDLGDVSTTIAALLGLWSHHTIRGDHAKAAALADRLATVAGDEPASAIGYAARLVRPFTAFWQGDIGGAGERLQTILEDLRDVGKPGTNAFSFPHPRVATLSYLSLVLWNHGNPTRAEQVGRDAVRTAEGIADPLSLAHACGFSAVLHALMRDPQRVRKMSDRLIDLAAQHGFWFWERFGILMQAWATADANAEQAAQDMDHEIQTLKDEGVRLLIAYPIALRAEILARLGLHESAVAELDAVLADCEERAEAFGLAEIRRIRACLLDASGRMADAQSEREAALEIADQQSSHAIIIRVINDMIRAGSPLTPARRRLLQISLDSFAPGCPSPDVVEAQTALQRAG